MKLEQAGKFVGKALLGYAAVSVVFFIVGLVAVRSMPPAQTQQGTVLL